MSNFHSENEEPPVRHGAVIVVPEALSEGVTPPITERRFLIIRRSARVIAPGKLCFPGGGLLPGESAEAAAEREFFEELGTRARIGRRIWENVTPWRVHLVWFAATLAERAPSFHPAPEEVAECFWLNLPALMRHPDLLTSNLPFLESVLAGKVVF